jgi:hypothetical protein
MPIEPANNVEILDEGVSQGRVRALDFTGTGVTASVSGSVATVAVAGGGSVTGRSVGITVDGAGAVLTTGTKGYIWCPFGGTIAAWYVVADQTGSCVLDVWKVAGPTVPTNADTITGSEKPTLTAQQANSDTALATWTTAVAAGDIFGFEIESASTVTRVTLTVAIN